MGKRPDSPATNRVRGMEQDYFVAWPEEDEESKDEALFLLEKMQNEFSTGLSSAYKARTFSGCPYLVYMGKIFQPLPIPMRRILLC